MSAKIIELPNIPNRPSIEDVKKLDSFKHYTDEEAEAFLQTIRTFCEIALRISRKNQHKQHPKAIPISQQQHKAA